jgi:outer membrane autotransporter protein
MKTNLLKMLSASLLLALTASPASVADDLPTDGNIKTSLTLSSATSESLDQLTIGSEDGDGNLTLSGGTFLDVAGDVSLGTTEDSSGTLTVDGEGTTLTISSEHLFIGYRGTGDVTISNDASLLTTWDPIPSGVPTYEGLNFVVVGYQSGSLGSLTISDGGKADLPGVVYLGYEEGSHGYLELTGEGTTLSIYPPTSDTNGGEFAGILFVGLDGTGELLVTDHAQLTLGAMTELKVLGVNAKYVNYDQVDSDFYLGFNNGSSGVMTVSNGGSVSIAEDMYIASHEGSSGTLTIKDGGVVSIAGSLKLGSCYGWYGNYGKFGLEKEYYPNNGSCNGGTATVNISGEGSVLEVKGDSFSWLWIMENSSVNLSDHGSLFVSSEMFNYGDLSMTTDSVLSAGLLMTYSGSTTLLTGTCRVGGYSFAEGSRVTLLATGASVAQGSIVVTGGSSNYEGSAVNVEFDLAESADELIGNTIYLMATSTKGNQYDFSNGVGYVDFRTGVYIEDEWQDVSKTVYKHLTKTVDGLTYDLDYLFNGYSITFGDTVTITPAVEPLIDDDAVISKEIKSEIFGRDVVGSISQKDNLSLFVPSGSADTPLSYAVAEGVSDDSEFKVATTAYVKETTTSEFDGEGNLIQSVMTVEDLGLIDLTLYANAVDATISGGTVGLVSTDEDSDADATDEGIRSMINNVVVRNQATLTLNDGNEVNADRRIQTNYGTLVMDNATMNIGGGNLDEFRANPNVQYEAIDWENLASSKILHSTVELSQGSTLNMAKVEDDQVGTTLEIDDSILALSDSSSVNIGEGINTTIDNSTIALANASSLNLALGADDTATIDHTTIDLSGKSSLNGSKSGDMTVAHSTIQGTGTVSNFTSKENTYSAGKDNTGVLELRNVKSYSDVMSTSIVGNRVTSGTYHSDATEGTGVISQLKITDGTTITDGAFQLAVIGDSSLLTEGSSFQVLDLDAPLEGGFTSFTETGTPLMDGYAWDYSLLNSQGIVSIILTELGDAPRVANTMYSSAKTVSYAGRVAMDHLQGYYGGPHDYHAEGNNFWVSSLGTYQCVANHKGRTGYTYQSMGYAVGYDRVFHEDRVIEGFDIGQTWGKHRPKQGTARYSAGKIDQDAVVATLYGMETLIRTINDRHVINLEHYVAYGSVRNKSSKTALFNNQTATAKWDDDVWCFGLRGVWNRQINEHWTVSPFVGIDYEHVSSDDFTESMGNNTARYTGGNYQNWDVSVGTAASYNMKFQNGMEVTPTASVAYVGSISRNVPTVSVSDGNGKSVREKAVNPGRNAFQASAGVNWKISQDWNMSANYDFYVAHGTTEHNANVTLSYAF